MDLHTQLTLIAFLGMVIEILAKYKALHDKAVAANIDLPFATFLKQDWVALAISAVTIIIALIALDTIVNIHVDAMKWVKFIFVFIGLSSSNLILRLGSVANKKINNIINTETGFRETKINIEEGSIKKNE